MGMGWHTLAVPEKNIINLRKCKCGKGSINYIKVITEESEYPPFERRYDYYESTCPDNCEKV